MGVASRKPFLTRLPAAEKLIGRKLQSASQSFSLTLG